MAESTPVQGRKGKHYRKRSSGDFSIEELLPDDMGYDADVEIIKPDKYEEIESEFEDAATPARQWHSVDEELAARMRQLGRENELKSEKGRKRRSIEMDDDTMLKVPQSPDIEVQEIVDSGSLPSPAKRRRKKSARPTGSRQLRRGLNEIWTDSSEKADSNGDGLRETSASHATSRGTTPRRDEDDEMIDVT